MKTQREVRNSFFAVHNLKREYTPVIKQVIDKSSNYGTKFIKLYRLKFQNEYNATIRTMFVDYVDSLQRSGEISDRLAKNVTLR